MERSGIERLLEGGLMAGTPGRAELEQLLAHRRYEEALEILRLARQKAPDVPELARGIQLLKQRLLRRYLHQLGDLDRVPRSTLDEAALDAKDLAVEERELLRLVDGIASYGDIVLESRFGRFETYRMLAQLVARGIVRPHDALGENTVVTPKTELAGDEEDMLVGETPSPVLAQSSPVPSVAASELSSVPTEPVVPRAVADAPRRPKQQPKRQPKRRSTVWIGACVGAALVAGGGVLLLRRAASDRPPAVAPAAAPVAVAEPPKPEPPKPEPEPPKTEPAPAPPAPPAEAKAEPPPEGPKPEPVAAALPLPAQTQPPPAPVAKASGRAAPAPAPAARHGIVDGPPPPSPSHDVIESVQASIASTFRSCYLKAAQEGGTTASPRAQVFMTIDEAGMARDLTSSAGKIPGLVECIRDASGRLRRGDPPVELGTVRVSFWVSLAEN